MRKKQYISQTYSSEHVKIQSTIDFVGHDNRTLIQTHEKYTREGKEKHLNRPRQQKTNSHGLKSTYSVPVSSYFDALEEVIYSQGDSYPLEHFDRSWDSDKDSKFHEDYTLPSRWI